MGETPSPSGLSIYGGVVMKRKCVSLGGLTAERALILSRKV